MELPFAVTTTTTSNPTTNTASSSSSSSSLQSGSPKAAATSVGKPTTNPHASLQDSTATAHDNDSLVTADSEESFHLSSSCAHEQTDQFEAVDAATTTTTTATTWEARSRVPTTDHKNNISSSRGTVSNVLSQLGLRTSSSQSTSPTKTAPYSNKQQQDHYDDEDEVIDFTYVNVQETDADEVDILLAGGDPGMMMIPQHASSLWTGSSEHAASRQPPNILALFLSGRAEDNEITLKLVDLSEQANAAVTTAAKAKQEFKLSEALDAHSTAARLFYDAALLLKENHNNSLTASMANSFLLLSQMEAKSALALKRVIKLRPNTLLIKERLRAKVRGALDKKAEADISDSMFLGMAGDQQQQSAAANNSRSKSSSKTTTTTAAAATAVAKEHETNNNPVDDIMQLERELQNMDMGLELGNSIASLDSRSSVRSRNTTIDGSFMVVPPGSNSYLSSSMVLPANTSTNTPTHGNHPLSRQHRMGKARANRVQNMIEAKSTPRPVVVAAPKSAAVTTPTAAGLESSWWGTASQVLSSSSSVADGQGSAGAAPTKQLMRLMDSLKTLTDENAALLREVEEAEAARAEAKAAKREMQRFRQVYTERFEKLKAALEKFRKGYPDPSATPTNAKNPVATSEYMQQASTSEHLARQEQLIRKLTTDLKKEKETSRKKDAALRRYEDFYRQVKARSAEKAAQRRNAPATGGGGKPPMGR